MPLAAVSYLEGGCSIEFGGINGVRWHICYIRDELLQVVTGLLQVSGIDDDLNQLRETNALFLDHCRINLLHKINNIKDTLLI